MEFKYDFSNGNSNILYYSDQMQILDEATWNLIRHNRNVPFLLPVEMRQMGGEYCFIYNLDEVTNMIAWKSEVPLEERGQMDRKIAEAVRELTQYQIPEAELVLEEKYLYVDDRTGNVRFICIPMKNSGTGFRKEKNTAKDDPLPMIPPIPDDDLVFDDYGMERSKKRGFFGRRKAKKAASGFIEPKVPSGYRETPAEALEYEPDPVSDFRARTMYEEETTFRHTDMPKYEKTTFRDIDTQLYEEEPRHAHSEAPVYDEGAVPQQEIGELPPYSISYDDDDDDDDNQTKLLMNDGDEGTVLLNMSPALTGRLVRVQTDEQFLINRRTCKIGKKAAAVDVWLRNNKAFSREHCIISYLSGTYYLEDCDSTNFTLLEGKRVMPGETVKLTDGCRIQLADEEFIFYEK